MQNFKKTLVYWTIFILFSAAFVGINFFGDSYVESLYETKHFDVLNKVCGVTENKSLGYYLGMWEDYLWGPIKSTIAGILLLSFCWIYMKTSNPFQFGLTIFLYLIITRPEVLFYPPYGEAIYGPVSDAVWLVRHSMQFLEFYKQETFTTGGPQVYPTSFYPSFMAIIMYLTKTPKAFLVAMHLLGFFFTATTVALLRKFLQKNTNQTVALLGSLFAISLPLFQSMAEMINMEMACLFFGMLSAYFLSKRILSLASICAICSMLVKAPGVVACGTVVFVSLFLCILSRSFKEFFRYAFWIGFTLIASILKAIIRSKMLGTQPGYNTVGFFIGWPNFKCWPIFWSFCGFLLVYIVIFLVGWIKNRKQPSSFRSTFEKYYSSMIMFVTASAWLLLYLNYNALNYRYRLFLAPFYVFCLIFVATKIFGSKKLTQWGLIVAIVFSFYCSHGFLYSEREKNYEYSYQAFERTLEYRNDLKLHQKLIKELEDNFSHFKIGAPFALAQAINFREIGYSQKPLGIMVYGIGTVHEEIEEFAGLTKDNIAKTLWIEVHSRQPEFKKENYPRDKRDFVVKTLELGTKKMVMFLGGFAINEKWIKYKVRKLKLMKERLEKTRALQKNRPQ